MLMAKNKKRKPSKRGMKAKNKSLHCSSTIKNQEKKIKKWTRWADAVYAFLKLLIKLWRILKLVFPLAKSLFEWLGSAL